jgi:DNA ligase-1
VGAGKGIGGEKHMADLEVGQTTEMKGSGSRPYIIKNCGAGGYSCTCPAWRNQSIDPARRTCKHIRKLRGDEAEEARLGAVGELPSRKPEGEATAPAVLLAEAWDTQTNLAGWWMSEKLDGVRAYWDGKQFLSRQGNLFLAPPWFVEGLPDTPLDGELWMDRKKFQAIVGIVKSPDRPEAWRGLRYVVFDAPAHGGAFESRLGFLEDFVRVHTPPFVQVLGQQPCKGVDHLRAELRRVEALGGEGLMLRQPGSRYEAGRSSTLLKVKTFHDAEARVVGHLPGEGKHKGRVGSLRVALSNGLLFSVGTGLSDAERVDPPPVGSVITFRYQELTDTGVPRFPSYVGVRRDGEQTPAPITPVVRTDAPPSVVVPAGVPAGPAEAVTRVLTYGAGAEARAWEATRRGAAVTLRFGPAGGPEQVKTLHFPDEAAAAAAVDEMIADKLDDGFVERRAGEGPGRGALPAPVEPGVKRCFELAGGASAKFWEVWVEGSEVWTRDGRAGAAGVKRVKKLADENAARMTANKMMQDRAAKGYVEKP